ncbi:MAG: pyocin knob domain-containing protein, partial [Pseudomonadales bacterium]
MFIQLTDAGVAMLTTTGQPFIVTEYRLGSAFNYTPQTNQTALQGTEVWSGVPSDPVEVSANLVRYSALLGMSVGDFQFGEFALYVGATMVAIGVSSTLIAKTKTTTGLDGNFLRLDAYLNMTGTNYAMWLNFGDSANPFAMPSVQNVDQLPPSHQSVPNAYIVNSVSSNQEAFFAYSDRTGLWVFDAYKYSSTIGNRYTIVSASSLSVTIANASLAPDLTPGVYGDRIVQFASGQVYSICRNVQTVTPDLANNQVTLGFQTPLAIVPLPGDEFLVYNRDPLSTDTVMVPVATTTSLGIIQVGDGLAITPAGILSVDRTTVPDGLVYSIAGIEPDGTPVQRQGDVTLTWRDVGAIRSVNSQLPDANGNVVINVSYTLPVASSTVLGGVRIQAGSGLQINPVNGDLSLVGAGTAVESVNSRPGPAVIVAGLVDPSPLANATDLNTVIVGKIYYAATDAVALSLLNAPTIPAGRKSATIEVVALYELAGTGDVMQRWTQEDAMVYRRLTGNSWGPWVNPSTAGLPIATTSTVGVVSISDGLNVSPVGVLKTNMASILSGGCG